MVNLKFTEIFVGRNPRLFLTWFSAEICGHNLEVELVANFDEPLAVRVCSLVPWIVAYCGSEFLFLADLCVEVAQQDCYVVFWDFVERLFE